VDAVEALVARLREGRRHLGGGMIRVSDFLNHQVDAPLLGACGVALADYWQGDGITKVLTAETSGIPSAMAVALALGVPMVYARKRKLGTLGPDLLSASAPSPTHGGTNDLIVAAALLGADDRVLIVDDFLASGYTIEALANIVAQAGAELAGVGAVIEKCYAEGRDRLRALGVPVVSLAAIVRADDSGLTITT
jgi:xanthine phosphoribosyltransferase